MIIDRIRMMVASGGEIGETKVFHAPTGDIVFNQNPLIRREVDAELEFMETWYETSSATTYGIYQGGYNNYKGTNYFGWSISAAYGGLVYGAITVGDYRLPTKTEFEYLYSNSRTGSTYNGISGAKWCGVETDVIYSYKYFSSTKTVTMCGIIFFPDNQVITGKTLTGVNNSTASDIITTSELNNLLKQGVLFMPGLGMYYPGSGWQGLGGSAYYWSSTNYDPDNTWYTNFYVKSGGRVSMGMKQDMPYDSAPMAAIMCRGV